MSSLAGELKAAGRSLSRNPVFSLLAALTIGLGIGTTTAIFSAVDGALLRPLPFREQAQLVKVWATSTEQPGEALPVAPADYLDWRKESQAFSDIAAFVGAEAGDRSDFNLTGGDRPERIQGAFLSPNLLGLLGVTPALGRGIEVGEEGPGRDSVVLLSDRLWRSRFAADPAVLGKTIQLNGRDVAVIGVLPAQFSFPSADVDIWVPFGWDYSTQRRGRFFQVVARLKPGTSLEQARADLNAVTRRLEGQYPETNQGFHADLMPLREWLVGDVRRPLLILLGSVALVLLIACSNVANLLLSRGAARQQEMAVRSAIGASARDLARQLLLESLVLACLGGALGLVLALFGTRWLSTLSPTGLATLTGLEISPRVLAFSLAVTLLSGLLFGLLPALYARRPNLAGALRQGSKGSAGSHQAGNRTRAALITFEVALSLVLAVTSGLLIRSYQNLQRVEPGFDSRGVLTFGVALPRQPYSTPEQIAGFYTQLVDRLAALPGVEAAGAVSRLPLKGLLWTTDFSLEGQGSVGGPGTTVRRKEATPGYFQALSVSVDEGRTFEATDTAESAPVVVVNRAFADQYLAGRSPVGAKLKFARFTEDAKWRTIVGVTANEKQDSLAAAVAPEVYTPFSQRPTAIMSIVVRGSRPPTELSGAALGQLRALDPTLPAYDVASMDVVVLDSMRQARFTAFLLVLFAIVALALAAVGIYGLVSYSVVQRRQEVGLRLALGAKGGQVLQSVVGRAMLPVAVGLGVGVFGALLSSRVLQSLLFGVEARDVATFILVPAALALIAFLACLIPALRVTKVPPGLVLR